MDRDVRTSGGSGAASLRFLDVYIAPVGTGEPREVLHPVRRAQIEGASSAAVKREKYYSWLLLEYALRKTLGLGIGDAGLHPHKHGGWLSSACHISISHSGGYVAVALSSAPVGVDIELYDPSRNIDGLAARWLTEKERTEYDLLSDGGRAEFFYEKWTKKESIFKREMGKSLLPSAIECDGYPTVTHALDPSGCRLLASVCSEWAEQAKVVFVSCAEYEK